MCCVRRYRFHCYPHTIHTPANDDSIAQRSPKMTVLMLDACTQFMFDKRPVEGSSNAHGLDIQSGNKLKNAQDYLFARACAPNAEAADTGKDTTTTHFSVCAMHCNAYAHALFLHV